MAMEMAAQAMITAWIMLIFFNFPSLEMYLESLMTQLSEVKLMNHWEWSLQQWNLLTAKSKEGGKKMNWTQG
jgi:hypothetical protein